MPLVIADRVKETSTTTGATNITLAGAATGYQTFNATIGVGNTCYYVIENPGTTEWEIGLGTLSAATTFTRTTVLKSSNSNTVVTFSTGTKNVFVTLPANQIVNYATLADVQTLTNKTLSTNVDYNGNLISGQYGGTGVANTGKTITIGGNLTTSGAFTTTLTSTANTSLTLPTTGTLATLAGIESFSNKYITTGAGNTTVAGLVLTSGSNTTAVANGSIEFDNTNFYFSVAGARKVNAYLDSAMTGTWTGTVVAGQYGGTGVANTGKTITIGGNLTTSGAFTTTLTATDNTSVTLPTTGTLATLTGIESFTNKTLSTNTTWNGNVIPGQYGGTGIANTGFTLTMAGNVTHAGAFARTLTATGTTSVTLPTAGTLATLAGIESFTNKTMSTNTTWNGNVIPGQYGGTGIANTGFTLTMAGNITHSGAFARTFVATGITSITLPTTGTLATLAGAETLSSKVVNLAAGNATVGPLRFTSGTNMTTAAAGNMEFDGTRLYFSPSTTRQTIAFLTDITGGATIVDDTTTAATRYLVFTSATSGAITTANVSSTKLTFNPATGDFTAGGNIIANSDERLKDNITTIEDALKKVNKLRGVEFDWKDTGIHSLGFIAQEVEKVLPDLVKEHDGIKSLAYGNMASLLVEAIKELSIKYNKLEEKYNKLIGE